MCEGSLSALRTANPHGRESFSFYLCRAATTWRILTIYEPQWADKEKESSWGPSSQKGNIDQSKQNHAQQTELKEEKKNNEEKLTVGASREISMQYVKDFLALKDGGFSNK